MASCGERWSEVWRRARRADPNDLDQRVYVCMYVCVREISQWVCLCARERERERER